MLKLAKSLAFLALAVGLTAGAASTASAQPNPPAAIAVPNGVAVPAPVPAGNYEGCWQITQQLYGPYYMNFCLRPFLSRYTVTGGGIYCDARLDWYVSQGQAVIQLRYTNCGNGVAWSPDTVYCVWANYTSNEAADLARPAQGVGPPDAIAVPNGVAIPAPVPSGGDLRCTYQPSVAGYQPISVLAQRTSY